MNKSAQVEQTLRRQIQRRHHEPGALLPSEATLMERFGVSRTTIRDALNSLASDGMLIRRQGMGTMVSSNLEANSVALIASRDFYCAEIGYYTRKMIDLLMERIEANRFRVMPTFCTGKTVSEETSSFYYLFERPIIRQLSGILSLVDIGLLNHEFMNRGIQNVSIVSIAPGKGNCVVFDYQTMFELAIQAIREHGYDDYAVMIQTPFRGGEDEQWNLELQKILKKVNFNPDNLILVESTFDMVNAYDSFKNWYARSQRPRALFVMDDGLFNYVSRACLEMRLRIPEDLGLITHANLGRSFCHPVKFDTICFDLEEAANTAWKMLDHLMSEGNSNNEQMVKWITPKLIRGNSL